MIDCIFSQKKRNWKTGKTCPFHETHYFKPPSLNPPTVKISSKKTATPLQPHCPRTVIVKCHSFNCRNRNDQILNNSACPQIVRGARQMSGTCFFPGQYGALRSTAQTACILPIDCGSHTRQKKPLNMSSFFSESTWHVQFNFAPSPHPAQHQRASAPLPRHPKVKFE